MKYLFIWLSRQDGATSIEYGLIVGGIAIATIAAVFAFGEDLGALFSTLATTATSVSGKI